MEKNGNNFKINLIRTHKSQFLFGTIYQILKNFNFLRSFKQNLKVCLIKWINAKLSRNNKFKYLKINSNHLYKNGKISLKQTLNKITLSLLVQ